MLAVEEGGGLEVERKSVWRRIESRKSARFYQFLTLTVNLNFSCYFFMNKTLRSVHFGVVVVELINCKCGGIVRNQIW